MKFLIFFFCFASLICANDFDTQHFQKKTLEAGKNESFSISYRNQQIREVYFHYRSNRSDKFKTILMKKKLYEFEISVLIPNSKEGEFFYYFTAIDKFGRMTHYPDAAEDENQALYSRVVYSKTQGAVNYQIISPAEGEMIHKDDFMIAVSILGFPSDINIKDTKVLIDGINISQYADIQEELISYVPVSTIKSGLHNLEIQFFNQSNTMISNISWSVTLTGDETGGAGTVFKGDIGLNNRSESYGEASDSKNYFTGYANLYGNMGKLDFTVRTYMSSEENDSSQSINRYSLGLKYPLWSKAHLRLGLGDVQPSYNDMMMNYYNFRGFDMGVMLGFMNFEFATGSSRREIVNAFSGSYERKVTTGRFSLGMKEEGFSLGFNFMKAKDNKLDTTSAKIIPVNPVDNFVFGPDFTIGFMNNRIKLEVGGLASLYQDNISGEVPDYETFSSNSGADFSESMYNTLNSIITLTGIPSVGILYYGGFNFNILSQNIRLRYEKVGDGFYSLGNPFLQSDLAKLTASWNSRIMETVYLNASFSQSNNNVAKIDSVSQNSQNGFGFGVTFVPFEDIPNINFSFSSNNQKTDLQDNVLSDNKMTSINTTISQKLQLLQMDHNVSVVYGSNKTEDAKVSANLVEGNMIGFNLRSEINSKLKTFVQYTTQNSKSGTITDINSNSLLARGDYEVFTTDKNDLNAYGLINMSSSKDSKSQNTNSDLFTFEVGAKYNFRFENQTYMNAGFSFNSSSVDIKTNVPASYSNSRINLLAEYHF